MQRQVNQPKHSQHKEEERSSANQNPEQGVGTSFSHGESLAPELGREHFQRSRLYGNFDRGPADVFAVSINIKRSFGFHAQACCREVIYFADVQMAAKVNCRKHAEKLEWIDAADHANV